MNLRREDIALETLEYPQVQYTVQGGYGEPMSAAAVVGIASQVGGFVGNLFGMSQQNKMAQAQMDAQVKMNRDQSLIQGQVMAQQAAVDAQHASNMPLYLLVGGGVILGLGIIITRKK